MKPVINYPSDSKRNFKNSYFGSEFLKLNKIPHGDYRSLYTEYGNSEAVTVEVNYFCKAKHKLQFAFNRAKWLSLKKPVQFVTKNARYLVKSGNFYKLKKIVK